ncbi:MAG: HEAT repeat domain-containing protein [Vicinamibacterales bacterium]
MWQMLGTLPADVPDSVRLRARMAQAVAVAAAAEGVTDAGYNDASDAGRDAVLEVVGPRAVAGGDVLPGASDHASRRAPDAASAVWPPVQARPSSAVGQRFGARPGDAAASVRAAWPWLQVAAAAVLLACGVWLGRQVTSPVRPDAEMAALRQELRETRELVTLSLLQQQSASERLKGVGWTDRLDEPGDAVVSALLDTLVRDPNVNVRLAAVDALARFGDRAPVRQGAVDALARQTSPLVQLAMIDFVVEVDARTAVPVLRRLSEDPALDASVRERAAWGLERLG